MNLFNDPQSQAITAIAFALLLSASIISRALRTFLKDARYCDLLSNLDARILAWWIMVLTFFLSSLIGRIGSIFLFSLISFLALREFITLTPTGRGDHRALFWVFFVIAPLQYLFLAFNWLSMFLIFVPVYGFLLIPIRNAITGDTSGFLNRTANIQWALMVCVYFVSYAPALLDLSTPTYHDQGAKLLFYFVFVVQISDVLQYVFGKLFGKHKISPNVSPNKTVEGLIWGVASAVLIGTSLFWLTPFKPVEAACMSLVITLMGFCGGLVMSAIKRDRGVKDYGALLPGHGGMLDRIDSICFAAPVFYHLTRYFFIH